VIKPTFTWLADPDSPYVFTDYEQTERAGTDRTA
jgi:hypothetical protein